MERFGEAGWGKEIRERIVPTQTGSGSTDFVYVCAHVTSNCFVTKFQIKMDNA